MQSYAASLKQLSIIHQIINKQLHNITEYEL